VTTSRGVALFGGAALCILGARTYIVRSAATSTPAASASSGTMLAHADHLPRHGGVVLMNGDTHFEVVLRSDGDYRVHFSDAYRNVLAPENAADVTVIVMHTSGGRETIDLHADKTCACWVGHGQPADDPFAVVRIGYTMDASPYWIDVPVSAWTAQP
jgi:hypothetical protein